MNARIVKNISIIFFPVIACVLIFLASYRYNLGVSSDSAKYIEVSKSIKEMAGVVNNNGKLVQHWPPLYPVVLAISSGLTGLSSLQTGKYLNAIFIALFFVVFNVLLRGISINNFLSVLVNLLLLFSLPLTVFSMFWSEGLFMLLLLTFLVFFLRWIDLDKRHLLIISGIVAGLMILTKYSALGFIGGTLFYLLAFRKDGLKSKLINVLFFTVSMVVILLPWIIYTQIAGEKMMIRTFAFHPVALHHIKEMGRTFSLWILPEYIGLNDYIFPTILIGISLLMLVVIFRYSDYKNTLSNINYFDRNYIILLLTLILSYLLFLFISISFFDAQTPLDNRILSPLFPLILLFISPFLRWIFHDQRLRILCLIIITVLILSTSVNSYKAWHSHYLNGKGYTSNYWKNSETLQRIDEFDDYIVYSNGPDVYKLYYNGNKKSIFILPSRKNPNSLIKNEYYDLILSKMKKSIETGNSVLIYFEKVNWRKSHPPKEELQELLKDFDIIQFKDGFAILNCQERPEDLSD